MNCSYCHFGEKVKSSLDNDEFSVDEIRTIITNLSTYISQYDIPTFKLGVVGSGESLLSFHLIEVIIEQIKILKMNIKFKLYTITNGTILTDYQLDFFFQNRDLIDLNFSLDGRKEIHNAYRCNFDLIMKNITRYEKKFGRKPKINAVVSKDTIENRAKIIDFFLDNDMTRVDFSMIFGLNNSELSISKKEYDDFLLFCENKGLTSRQNTVQKKYDCSKYGNLCGVGRTNIFLSRGGVFPCSRFLGDSKYKLAEYSDNWNVIEERLSMLNPISDGMCYFEVHKGVDEL